MRTRPESPYRRRLARRTRSSLAAAVAACLAGLVATVAAAAPIAVKYRETPTHGFLDLRDASGAVIAHGEVIQRFEKGAVMSRLLIHFDDGSLYDEIVRFSQSSVFRLIDYHLTQKGPSFKEASQVSFDRSGHFAARVQPRDGPEERASGTTDIPADVYNGITSTVLKNLPKGAAGKTHMMAFTPKPRVLDLESTPQGSEPYWVGPARNSATRFSMKPSVSGVAGLVATVAGKQPPTFEMWIDQTEPPTLVRFEGPLYQDGPTWHIGPSSPRWSE